MGWDFRGLRCSSIDSMRLGAWRGAHAAAKVQCPIIAASLDPGWGYGSGFLGDFCWGFHGISIVFFGGTAGGSWNWGFNGDQNIAMEQWWWNAGHVEMGMANHDPSGDCWPTIPTIPHPGSRESGESGSYAVTPCALEFFPTSRLITVITGMNQQVMIFLDLDDLVEILIMSVGISGS